MQERLQPQVRGYGSGTTYDEDSSQASVEQSATENTERSERAPVKGGGGTPHNARADEPLAGSSQEQTGVRIDERIRQQVCQRLCEDAQLDASGIAVSVAEREVLLRGQVLDQRARFQAEDLAAGVFAVRGVQNQLATRKSALGELGSKVLGENKAETADEDHTGIGPASCARADQINSDTVRKG